MVVTSLLSRPFSPAPPDGRTPRADAFQRSSDGLFGMSRRDWSSGTLTSAESCVNDHVWIAMIRHAIVAAEIGEFGARVACVCGAAITRPGGARRQEAEGAEPWGQRSARS